MLKDKTLKGQTSDNFSIDDLEFLTELNSQQTELTSGRGIGGYWGINSYGQYVYITPDYGSVPLAGYPTGPIDPQGYMLNQEARSIYGDLQGIFTYLPNMQIFWTIPNATDSHQYSITASLVLVLVPWMKKKDRDELFSDRFSQDLELAIATGISKDDKCYLSPIL